MASVFWDAKGILLIDYLQKRPIYQWGILFQLAEAAAKGNQVKTAWGTEEGSSYYTRTMLLHTIMCLQWLLCATAVALNRLVLNMKKKDDEVILSAGENFSRIRMRASIPRESTRCNSDGRSVRKRMGLKK